MSFGRTIFVVLIFFGLSAGAQQEDTCTVNNQSFPINSVKCLQQKNSILPQRAQCMPQNGGNYCAIPACATLSECTAAKERNTSCPSGKIMSAMGCIDDPSKPAVTGADCSQSGATCDAGDGDGDDGRVDATPTPGGGGPPRRGRVTAKTPTPTPAKDEEAAEKKDPTGEEKAETKPEAADETPGPGDSGPSDSEYNACYSAASAATGACGGTPPVTYKSGGGGIYKSAAELSRAASAAARAAYEWGTRCTMAWNQCYSSCSGVDNGAASRCQSYARKVADAGKLTTESLNDAVDAETTRLGSSPGRGQGPTSDDPYKIGAGSDPTGCAADPGSAQCLLCTRDPSHPSCGGASSPQAKYRENDSTRRTLDEFNTPAPSGYLNTQSAGAAAAAATAGVVPNGGGGGIPGSGSNGANMAGKAKGKPANSNLADIMQGERGGSGWAGYGRGTTNEFEDRSRIGNGGARGVAGNGKTPYDGMDLKKYLPGGTMDPRMGGLSGDAREITSKFGLGNFQKITNRFRLRCSENKLDCP